MNEQDFILLLEQYLDGSISADGRRNLSAAVQADPERRRLFEEQARQHVRLHAQTSRIDFTESQRVAVMVMDVVAREHESHFTDILREQSIRERFQAIARGLRAPRGSGPNRYARYALLRLFGPPGLSLAVSAAIVLLLAFFAVPVVAPPGTDELIIEFVARDRLPPAPEPDPLPPVAKPETPAPEAAPGIEANEPPAPPTRITWEDPAPQPPAAVPLPPTQASVSPKTIPAPLAGRTPDGRIKALANSGGTANSEKAVANALRWLRDHQQDDGSWAGQDKAAMTGLALLAYLGCGQLPSSPDFGPTVRKGLDYLLAHQDARGAFSRDVYAHAIATYALGEASTLTRHMGLRDPLERAVALIVNGQQPDGSFDYHYAQGSRFDTSVTGWQIQALKAAKMAGSTHPGLSAALDRCTRFLKNEAFAADGSGFVYTGSPGQRAAAGATWTMTGVGTLGLQLLEQPHAPQTRAGLKALEDVTFAWAPVPAQKPRLYGIYYVTQAKFQQDNRAVWNAWNQHFQPVLLARQKPDGHWEGGDYDQGSHVYTTALCTLMLEVYYRYLPTYGLTTNVLTTAGAAGDDVGVRVR